MDGFTGINESAIHAEIENFQDATRKTMWAIFSAEDNFFSSLGEKWASPEAHEKSANWCITLNHITDNLQNDSVVTIDKVEDIATILARAVGGTYNRVGYNMKMNEKLSPYRNPEYTCKEEINGSIAMDVSSVKIILGLFNDEMSAAISSFDSIPTELSVYDANGAIKASFSNKVTEIKESAEAALKEINTSIQESINSYTSNITQAADNASSIMSSTTNSASPKATMTTLNGN